MQENLKVAMLQSDLVWENPAENRKIFTQQIEALNQKVDLILLPEMFNTGFSMNPKGLAETMQGETIKWLKKLAAQTNAAISGSLIIKEEQHYYNRLVFVEPLGKIQHYDKRHTFTLAGEGKVYKAGTKRLILNFKGWKICPLICYDLRFPVWSRNSKDYDLLIYVANWPSPRIEAWNCLLKARAIENMAYCIGVNRVGKDNNGYQYSGNSAAHDSLGQPLTNLNTNVVSSEIIDLSKEHLLSTRKKFQFLEDRDAFKIIS